MLFRYACTISDVFPYSDLRMAFALSYPSELNGSPSMSARTFVTRSSFKVPINPKLLFCLNKYMYNSEQNGAKIFDLGQNRNFL